MHVYPPGPAPAAPGTGERGTCKGVGVLCAMRYAAPCRAGLVMFACFIAAQRAHRRKRDWSSVDVEQVGIGGGLRVLRRGAALVFAVV